MHSTQTQQPQPVIPEEIPLNPSTQILFQQFFIISPYRLKLASIIKSPMYLPSLQYDLNC